MTAALLNDPGLSAAHQLLRLKPGLDFKKGEWRPARPQGIEPAIRLSTISRA
jgi:hypothetical protein